MSKNILLVLPDELHEGLKQFQIDQAAADRVVPTLNEILVNMVEMMLMLPDDSKREAQKKVAGTT
jgi:hypothetical protein